MKKIKAPKSDEMDFDLNPGLCELVERGRPAIFAQSRAKAIADGMLIDATCFAKEVGFTIPVAITKAAWERCIEIPTISFPEMEERACRYVLIILACASRRARSSKIEFEICVRNEKNRYEEVPLKAICGPGDEGEPVICVMLGDER